MFRKMTTLLIVSTALAGSVAMAEADVEVVVEYRHSVMESLKGHVSATAQILMEDHQAPDGHLAAHATAIASMTQDIPALFPEGSTNEETEALPSIWEKWDKFKDAADAANSAAGAFAWAVESGNNTVEQVKLFEGLLDTCRGCHDDFREEHD